VGDAQLERLLAAGGVGAAACLAAAALPVGEAARGLLLGAAAALFVCFLGSLRARLRRGEGETAPLSALAVIAGSAVAAVYALAAAEAAAPVLPQTPPATPPSADLDPILFAALFPQAVFVAGASAAAARTGALPRGLAKPGAVVAALQLVAAALMVGPWSIATAVAVAFVPYCAWLAAASVAAARR
jgi:hypothetical protein